MEYVLKNPLMKNTRKDFNTSGALLRFFMRYMSAPLVSAALNIPKPTVYRMYHRTRQQLFSDPVFTQCMYHFLDWAHLDGMRLLIDRFKATGPSPLYACAYHCDTGTSPKKIFRALSCSPLSEKMYQDFFTFALARDSCKTCALRWSDHKPPAQLGWGNPHGVVERYFRSILRTAAFHKKMPTSACWMAVLNNLGKCRGVTEQNISCYFYHAVLCASVWACDVPLGRVTRPDDHPTILVPNSYYGEHTDENFCAENAFEAAMIDLALGNLRHRPL